MARARQLVICIDNSGYEVSLERRKIYVCIPDTRAEKSGHLRVIDESGEDYLYPKESFLTAELTRSVRRARVVTHGEPLAVPTAEGRCLPSVLLPVRRNRSLDLSHLVRRLAGGC